MLKNIKTASLTGLAALTLTSAFTLEAHAQSSAQFNDTLRPAQQSFDNRRAVRPDNNNDQVVSGLIGAVAGGVIGSQVAGNGARTEGSILGALIGGVAGAAIADNNNRSRRFDKSRRFDTRQRFNNSYRSDFGYTRYGNSRYDSYNRRGFYNDKFISRDSSASGFPPYKGFGSQLGPHGSDKRTSLLSGRF